MKILDGWEGIPRINGEGSWLNWTRYAALDFESLQRLTGENHILHRVRDLILRAAGYGEGMDAGCVKERVGHFKVVVPKRKPGYWRAVVEMVDYASWNRGTGPPAGYCYG